MENKRNYYTVKEVREKVFDCNISLTTLHHLINAQKIPYVQLCRKRLVPAWWVEQAIKRGRVCNIAQ